MKKSILTMILALVTLTFVMTGCGNHANPGSAGESSAAEPAAQAASCPLSFEGYTLDQVTVLSRHNIRSPLSGSGSQLDSLTPHEWFHWSSEASQLSVRGGTLETMIGQYFRKWMETEGLFPSNYIPEEGAVRVYANSKQRTLATAEFFSAGLLPVADMDIESHMDFDQMDPVFTPQLTFCSDAYVTDAKAQIMEQFSGKIHDLADNYKLLMEVTDMKDSPAWKDGSVSELNTEDTEIILENNAEPGMSGSLKTACSVSDALVLQYYEEPDPGKAAFGHKLSGEEWDAISEIKDVYGDVLFTAPLVAANAAHPLLQEIQSELTTDGRRFTFLCGHDSNIGSVLASLGVEEYQLPDTIEKKTPIGCKLVFSRWHDGQGQSFFSVDLIYQTTDQLRNLTLLDMEHPPAVYPLSFSGLEKNGDGLYAAGDVLNRLQQAIEEYDRMVETYGNDGLMEDAAA